MAAGPRFSVAGIPVRVDPTFFVTAVVLGLIAPGRGASALAIWVTVMFVAVVTHELGHALAYRGFGVASHVDLVALGGFTQSRSDQVLAVWRNIVVLAAGPAVGLVLGGAALALSHYGGASFDQRLASAALDDLVFTCLGWGLLNLLPILPLDGGQIVRLALHRLTGGRGERPALVVSLTIAGAGLAAAVAVNQPLVALSAAWFVFDNWRSFARTAPIPDQGDLATWLTEGYEALQQDARLAASNRARQVLASSGEHATTESAVVLLMWCLLLEGRGEEAAGLLASNPPGMTAPVVTTPVLRATGGEQRAVRLVADLFRLRPGDETAQVLARALLDTGRVREAMELVCDPDGDGVGIGTRSLVGAALFQAGRVDEAIRVGQTSFDRHHHPVTAYNLACCLARKGEVEPALEWLSVAVDHGYDDLDSIDLDPDLTLLRGQPHFDDVRTRVGRSRRSS